MGLFTAPTVKSRSKEATQPMICLYGKHEDPNAKTQQINGLPVKALQRVDPEKFDSACRFANVRGPWEVPRVEIRCTKKERKSEFEEALNAVAAEADQVELVIATPRRKGTVDAPVHAMNRQAGEALLEQLIAIGEVQPDECTQRLGQEPYIIARLEDVPLKIFTAKKPMGERVRDLLKEVRGVRELRGEISKDAAVVASAVPATPTGSKDGAQSQSCHVGINDDDAEPVLSGCD